MKGLSQKSRESVEVETAESAATDTYKKEKKSPPKTIIDRKSIFEKWADKFREFLDNAE